MWKESCKTRLCISWLQRVNGRCMRIINFLASLTIPVTSISCPLTCDSPFSAQSHCFPLVVCSAQFRHAALSASLSLHCSKAHAISNLLLWCSFCLPRWHCPSSIHLSSVSQLPHTVRSWPCEAFILFCCIVYFYDSSARFTSSFLLSNIVSLFTLYEYAWQQAWIPTCHWIVLEMSVKKTFFLIRSRLIFFVMHK